MGLPAPAENGGAALFCGRRGRIHGRNTSDKEGIGLKMPDTIEDCMLAPCGMNCAVCYKHVSVQRRGTPCEGCLKGDAGKPAHCSNCKIKGCAQEKGHTYCFACADFPCKLIINLDKSYRTRYAASLVENSRAAQEKGVSAFLEQDRQKWTCPQCGGAFSLHDGACSECGNTQR